MWCISKRLLLRKIIELITASSSCTPEDSTEKEKSGVLTHGVVQDVALPHAFLYLGQLQSHARTNLQTAQQKPQVRFLKQPGVFNTFHRLTHLSQAHGALLRRHIPSARVGLGQLCDVVLAILFRFTFRKVGPPERWWNV